MRRPLAVLIALLLLLAGCAKKKHVARVPVARPSSGVAKRSASAAAMPKVGDEETGMASWYGHPYHGRPCSNGEIYDMEKLTAAHRTLPFGTKVEVRNLNNDRTVEVRINDRGPFVDGRIIDLSRAAAREIQMLGPGTAKVRLHVTGVPEDAPGGYFAVQAGAFRERANADRRRSEMEKRYGTATIALRNSNPPLWRVLVGRETSLERAGALAEKIKKDSGPAFVVRIDGPNGNQ